MTKKTHHFRVVDPGLTPLGAFLRGFVSIFDVARTKNREALEAIRSRTVEEAWRSDWEAIGGDFRHVIEEFDLEAKTGIQG